MDNKLEKKIKGLGIDIIEIKRIEKSIDNIYFLKKIYSVDELQLLKSKNAQSYSGNFAAKEAFVKALGTGFVNILPNEIEVLRDEKNKPFIKITPKILDSLKTIDGNHIHISISHSKEIAQAICIIE
ncbi:MAG: holo-ACP synthase [Lachnospirales bacterium]